MPAVPWSTRVESPEMAAARCSESQLFAVPGQIPGELSGHRDTAIWPFAYPVLDDALSGTSDGILKRSPEGGSGPKIIHIDSENEVVGGYGWMLTTRPDGHSIAAQPDNVRLYALAGTVPAKPGLFRDAGAAGPGMGRSGKQVSPLRSR